VQQVQWLASGLDDLISISGSVLPRHHLLPCVRMHGAVTPLLHMHSWNRTRTALAYSMQIACGGTPCHLFCIREETQVRISAWRTDNLINVSWLGPVFSDNFWNIIWKGVTTVFFHVTNECRGGMISLVLQNGCPNISVMLWLVPLSCCQDYNNLTHMPPKTVSNHILSSPSYALILCRNRGHVALQRNSVYRNITKWRLRLVPLPPQLF